MPYERALDIASKSGQLGRTEERILLDQLGMSYGLTKALDKARGLFARAIAKDPDYAMYYYNLACVCAEMGELDAAILNLGEGFERRVNMVGQETYPNPRTDDSFKGLLGNKKFERALSKMGF